MNYKKCTICNKEKPITDFHKQKAGKYGVTSRCKSCVKQHHIDWYTKNREKRIIETSEYRKSKPSVNKAAQRKWRSSNLPKDAAKSARRRSFLLKAIPSWSDEFDKFFIQEIYALAAKRTELLGIDFAVDHIVPLNSEIVCGLHCKDNLQILTASENSRKSNRYWPDMP